MALYKSTPHSTPLTEASEVAAAAAAKSKIVLYLSEDCQAYVWQKVALVASLVGEPIESIKLSAADFATLAPHARSVVLVLPNGGKVMGPGAASRYLAALREDLEVLGPGEGFGMAKVDQWVDFVWHEIEVVVGAVLLPARDGEPPFNAKQVAAMASKDLTSALASINFELVTNTYLAGTQQPSLADCAAVCALSELLTQAPQLLQGLQFAKSYPHLTRWFLTCCHLPPFQAILGEAPLSAMKTVLKELPAVKKPPTIQGGAAAVGGGAKKGGNGSAASGGAASAAAAGAGGNGGGLRAGVSAVEGTPTVNYKFNRTRTRIVEVIGANATTPVNATVTVKGWARTVRSAAKGKLLFVVLNDGSCAADLQCVVTNDVAGFAEAQPALSGGTGAAYAVTGVVAASEGAGQKVELKATSVELLGPVLGGEDNTVGGAKYPLSKKGHSLEYMRKIAHLRPRTRSYAATQRLRNAMAYATHTFFHERGFLYVHTPLITASDCEGAGEQFHVTTMLPKEPKGDLPRTKTGEVDYTQDFFGVQAGLTVSGQLNVETHACAMSDVYTFGPTFRAEDSHTSRHLAEFWMIEPEIAFAGLQEDMDLAEDYLKFCVHYALANHADDLAALEEVEGWDANLRSRLKNVLAKPFTRLTYTKAIEILQKEVKDGKVTFVENEIEWGMDMGSEHERYLAEVLYEGPVVVTNYPKGIKAFYMKLDRDAAPGRETVQGMDILVPRIGEIIGGSVREDDYELLKGRAAEVGISEEQLSWYLDLRKYGTCPHAGFGLGFERLVMLVTGVENIRDTIPFPRYPGHAEF